MSFESAPDDNIERYRQQYARSPSPATRQLEKAVLGRDVGLNGYTTVEQAQRLASRLDASRPTHVLDLGTGRGWPGSYVAGATGCRLVATDVPLEALMVARGYLETNTERGQTCVASADGQSLPFPSEQFDAVIHADVLC